MDNLLCVLLSCIFLQGVISAGTDKTFIALVVEFQPITDGGGNNVIQSNLDRLDNALKSLSGDLIVLPEYGLTGLQTDNLETYANVLTNDVSQNQVLKRLNDIAKTKNAYIVANLLEKEGNKLYSTSVVVNGTEQLVAKYRKINLNGTEVGKLTAGDFVQTFDSPRLGKVGLLSGNDILKDNFSKEVLKNITTIIYTTAFKSSLPFKAALSVQQGYAQANGINLVAANLNDPVKGFGGSGIYSQNTILQTYIDATPGTKILSDNLKVLDKRSVCQDALTHNTLFTNFIGVKGTDKNISSFTLGYELPNVVLSQLKTSLQQLCDGSFCCTFNVTKVSQTDSETYSLAVKAGGVGGKICALLLCDKNGQNCGKRVDNIKTKFSQIQINAPKSSEMFRPYTLLNTLMPIAQPEKSYYCQNDTGVTFSSKTNTLENLVAFGIVADTVSGSSSLQITMGVNLIAVIAALKYFL